MSDSDGWGRPRPQVPISGGERPQPRRGPLWATARGIVFVPGVVLTLILTFVLAHTGLHELLVYANLLLIPAAIACWVRASTAKGGDAWTLGYVAAVGLDYLLVGVAVRILI